MNQPPLPTGPIQPRNHLRWGWAALFVCFIPLFLNAFGFYFTVPGLQALPAPLLPLLKGFFLHLFMDWTACGVALFIAGMSLLHYRMSRNALVLSVGAVFLVAAALDCLNATATGFSPRDWNSRIDSIAWTWSIGRLFHASALWALFSRPAAPSPARLRMLAAALLLAAVFFGLLAWVGYRFPLPERAAVSFRENRPLELLGLLLYVASGPLLLKIGRNHPYDVFLFALLGSLIPESLAQLYMCLGPVGFLGNDFNMALLLKIAAYLLPAVGLTADYFRLQREKTVQEGLARFQTIAESASDGILALDEENNIAFANRVILETFGYEHPEIAGQPLALLVPAHRSLPPPADAALRPARVGLEAGKTAVELSGLKKDGQWIPLELSMDEFTDGMRRYLVALVRNTAERKKWEETLQNRERYYQAFLEASLDPIVLLDSLGSLLFATPSFEKRLGLSAQVAGTHIAELVHPDDFSDFQGKFNQLLAMPGSQAECLTRMRHKNGSWRVMELTLNNLMHSPAVGGIVGVLKDVTEIKKIAAALRQDEERYDLIARGSNGGIWDWDLRTDEIYFSPRWKAMLGYDEKEIGCKPEEWFDRVHPDDLEALKAAISDHLSGAAPFFEREHRMLSKNGDYLWVVSRGVALRDALGKATRMAGSQTDVSGQKRVEEQLTRQAYYDPLTGLPNRNLLLDRLQRAIHLAKRRKGLHFAVIFLDLDRFKGVNDSLGHMLGDQLLVETSRRLEKCLRPSDMAARLGGDEFTVLLEEIKDIKEAIHVADRILKELAQPYTLNGQEVFATVSMGIAIDSPDYAQPEELLRDADTAMYRAKANGKARYEIFDMAMHAHAVDLLRMENDLWRAIDHHEFVIHYQPMVSLQNGSITGFEALIRWLHPERGLLPPGEFIPLAEETGLIVAIGEWLLKTACAQNRSWQAMGHPDLRLAVNFSARQLQHPDPLKMIQNTLWENHMSAKTLRLEVTESMAMKKSDPGYSTLFKLNFMGIPISIDDFGTGYSSLSSLKKSPANILKIDQSFLKNIETDPDNAAITSTIIAMAHSLQLQVVAEGVENENQLEFLLQKDCDEVQGFYFSQPLSPEKATELLRKKDPFHFKTKAER